MKKILIVFITLACFFLPIQIAESGSEHNIIGWAWSETIGWISFNSTSGGGVISYGVNLNPGNGKLSGHAWAENIGWISFNESDTGVPPSDDPCSDASCIAKATPSGQLGKGNVNIYGWARALNHTSGWDGWIRFDHGQTEEAYVDPSGEFHGWAWSSDVIGWVKFYGAAPEYKVQISSSFNYGPEAIMSCDASGCSGGECSVNWIAYRSTANPIPCVYKINNDSTDPDGLEDIIKSEWYMKEQGQPDESYILKLSCSGICDYTLQNMPAANYVVKLYVEDSGEESSFTTHNLALREEVKANFMCSLDNTNWSSCSSFSVAENEVVYFNDDPLLSNHSVLSGGASSFQSRIWEKGKGGSFEQFASGTTNPSTTVNKDQKVIRLTVVDNTGRTDYQEYTLFVNLPLPDWREIAPF